MCHISELCRYLLNSATRVTEVLLYHGGEARGCGFGRGGADARCIDDTKTTAERRKVSSTYNKISYYK